MRYEILDQLSSGDISTHAAVAADGTRVMVHFLPAEHSNDYMTRLDALPETLRRRVRAKADLAGIPVVVTDYLEAFESFLNWIDPQGERSSSGPPVAPREPEAEDSRSEGPGAFTRYFLVGDDKGAVPEAEAAGKASVSESAPPVTPPPEAPPNQPASAEIVEPEPELPSATEPSPPNPPGGTREFARLFGGAPAEPEKQDIGRAWKEPESLPGIASRGNDYLDRLGAARSTGGPSPPLPAEPVSPPEPPSFTPSESGPSEYSRFVASRRPPPPDAAPPIEPRQERSARSGAGQSRWPYLVGLAAIVLLTIAVIIVFALTSGGDPPPGEESPETPVEEPAAAPTPPEEGR